MFLKIDQGSNVITTKSDMFQCNQVGVVLTYDLTQQFHLLISLKLPANNATQRNYYFKTKDA